MATEHPCADVLREELAPIEITVSTVPPLVATAFTADHRCPHGITYWIEPTAGQVARWQDEGVA